MGWSQGGRGPRGGGKLEVEGAQGETELGMRGQGHSREGRWGEQASGETAQDGEQGWEDPAGQRGLLHSYTA